MSRGCLPPAGEDEGAINSLDRAHSARWPQVLLQQVGTPRNSLEISTTRNLNEVLASDLPLHELCRVHRIYAVAGCEVCALQQR